MMINLSKGDLLQSDAEAVINTVNTVGVMGKGIALQFKKAYPNNFVAYKKACDNREIQPGRVFVYDLHGLTNPRYIVNFPTKRHWRGNSKMEDIDSGLTSLVSEVKRLGIRSVAVPPLGCGLGGLPWSDVFARMEVAFQELPDVTWMVYSPEGAPEPKEMLNRTRRPNMTKGRAAVLGLMNRYLVPGFAYSISLLEVQKLVYFLTVAGEHLNQVEFKRHHYGPYADVLRHVLEKMDGHFIYGYGDGNNTPETPIELDKGSALEAERYLQSHPDTLANFDMVTKLIEGFESPLGMELLSTVHWVATHDDDGKVHNSEQAMAKVQAWSPRKAKIMKPKQVNAAWERLASLGWI